MDGRYFNYNPSQIILGELLYGNWLYSIPADGIFYDIHLILGIFQKFEKKNNTICNDKRNSLRNIFVYSGCYHSKVLNNFLFSLPELELTKEGNVIKNQEKIHTIVRMEFYQQIVLIILTLIQIF